MPKIIVVLFVAFLLVSCGKQSLVQQYRSIDAEIQQIQVDMPSAEVRRIRFSANENVHYAVDTSRMDRVVVTVEGAAVAESVKNYSYQDARIARITWSQEDGVSRFTLLLADPADTDVQTDQTELVITLRFGVEGVEPSATVPPAVTESLPVEESAFAPATKLTALTTDGRAGLFLRAQLNGVARITSGTVRDGVMFVDLFGVEPEKGVRGFRSGSVVKEVAVNRVPSPNRTRILITLREKVPLYTGYDGTTLIVSDNPADIPQSTVCINALEVSGKDNFRTITIKLTGKADYYGQQAKGKMAIVFPAGICLLKGVPAVQTFPVGAVASVTVEKTDEGDAVVISPRKDIFVNIEETNSGLVVYTGTENFLEQTK